MPARSIATWFAVLVAVVFFGASALSAQVVRGSVVDERGTTVSGAIVLLLDSAQAIAGRALTDENGAFQIAAPRAGSFRLRSQRIGYQPSTSEAFRLNVGASVAQRVVLAGARISLDAVRVAARTECRVLAQDSAVATAAVWEQVRLALAATAITSSTRAITATTELHKRTLDRTGRQLLNQQKVISTGRVEQPWRGLSPDSLHTFGYVRQGRDSVDYYAPAIDALLSSYFVADHCLHLTASRDSTLIGLAFEPIAHRRSLPEIYGTLWLSRSSAELRRLDFGYVNVSRQQQRTAGGDVHFTRLTNGTWLISRWSIRMPILVETRSRTAFSEPTIAVRELLVTTGELTLAVGDDRKRADTLYIRPTFRISGTVTDSLSAAPIRNARVSLVGAEPMAATDSSGQFTIVGVTAGEYELDVANAWPDALNVTSRMHVTVGDRDTAVAVRITPPSVIAQQLCRTTRFGAAGVGDGVIIGNVQSIKDSTSASGARVVVQWTQQLLSGTSSRPTIEQFTHALETRTDARGDYRACGVPINTALVVRASSETGNALPVTVRIPTGARFGQADLLLEPASKGAATLSGNILSADSEQPIIGAEISVNELALTTRSNVDGSFRLSNVPRGTYTLSVKRIGFVPLTATVELTTTEINSRRILLRRVALLDSVLVSENAVIPSFEEHRRTALGHFLTRDDLARMENLSTAAIVAQFAGANVVGANGTRAWLTGRRSVTSTTLLRRPSPVDSVFGAKPACYAQVYVDNSRVYGGRAGEPLFDLSTFNPDQIEAIEYYAGPSETPSRYASLNSNCGVIVIWTRRAP